MIHYTYTTLQDDRRTHGLQDFVPGVTGTTTCLLCMPPL